MLHSVRTVVNRNMKQRIWLCILCFCVPISPAAANPQDQRAAAEQFLAAGKVEEAEATLVPLVKVTPTDAAAWNMLGAIHAHRGDLAQAERDFLQAVKYNPRLTPSWLN